jgi:Siphovirus Gp157
MSAALSLYGLSHNFAHLQKIEDLYHEQEDAGKTDPVIESLVLEFIETKEDLENKLDSYCSWINDLEAIAEAREREAKRIKDLAAANLRKADRLREAMKDALNTIGSKKIKTTRFDVSVRKAGGKPALLIEESENIPNEWLIEKVVVMLDKEKIRKALEEGEYLPFAKLAEKKEYLNIC